ncbi:MAG: rod shape-determining protein MreC [Lachnospiraceae bacterium]
MEKQLELSAQYDYDKVGARVIARDSDNWFNVFTIDKGSDDGIEVNNNVISNGGLVGIVTDVGPNTPLCADY